MTMNFFLFHLAQQIENNIKLPLMKKYNKKIHYVTYTIRQVRATYQSSLLQTLEVNQHIISS